MKKSTKRESTEYTPKRVKLLTINRYNLFLILLPFLLIINILVGLNINFLYLRQILSFLFLLIVPGLLIMLSLKIRSVKFWEYFAYTIGLSVTFILFSTLFVNWILPLLNITNQPLFLYPLLMCLNIILIIIGIVAWRRNKDLQYNFTTPHFDKLNNILFIIPISFPFLAILGAFLINNHGSSIITMLMFAGIAVYLLLLFVLRKRLDENIFPWALWMIGLALLFTFSMRSWYVSGNDISLEYRVLQITQQNGVWTYQNYRNAYNACLSIIFVPIVYKLMLNVTDSFVFKVVFPIIFSTLILIVYTFIRRKFDKVFSFISVAFFLSWIWFIDPMLTLARQEIAFIFFALMLLVIFSEDIPLIMKRTLFLVFGFSMILSHYSTSYVALSLFALTYIVVLIYRVYRKMKNKKINNKEKNNSSSKNKPIYNKSLNKKSQSNNSEFYIHGFLIFFLLLFGFLWLSQITTASNGLLEFSQRSTSSLDKIFTNELKIESLNKIAAFAGSDISKVNITSLVSNITSKYLDDYIVHEYPSSYNANYTPHVYTPASEQTHENKSYPAISLLYKITLTLFEIFFVLGVIFLVFSKKKNKYNLSTEHIILIFLSLFFLLLMIVLPYVSLGYNFERLYLQLLILLCPIPVLGSLLLLGKLIKNKENIYLIFLIVSILLLLFNYGFLWKIANADTPSFILENKNINYDFLYTHSSEIYSGEWIKDLANSSVQMDSSSEKRLNIYNSLNSLNNLSIGVFPLNINNKSYVYMDYANTVSNVLFISYNGAPIRINYPVDFISENKNKVYNNGESQIFK